MKAIRKVFPDSNLHGCNFHFAQNIWRHVQEVGLQVKYSEDPDFALNIRYLLALPFVPINDVDMAFDAITSSDFYIDIDKKEHNTAIQTLLSYVESTYVGRFDRRGKRRPGMFPINLWNLCDLTVEDNTLDFSFLSFHSILIFGNDS